MSQCLKLFMNFTPSEFNERKLSICSINNTSMYLPTLPSAKAVATRATISILQNHWYTFGKGQIHTLARCLSKFLTSMKQMPAWVFVLNLAVFVVLLPRTIMINQTTTLVGNCRKKIQIWCITNTQFSFDNTSFFDRYYHNKLLQSRRLLRFHRGCIGTGLPLRRSVPLTTKF